ncbi:hypothetical protein GDO78_006653 [Eleutherodactylus coqui]|uniref:OCEL domain-containing protein n=1 Tax=Eleutherodactylus coqui TaxID=57060 RepID=A0A8J6KBQ0_ELECQ|nr:hypothetical protein GDO78_006653 [Eleutherodactylus coqui]
MPDYSLKYAAIASQEQRQSYKNDFNAEYNEYRDLHARIERITSRFTQLDSQLKQLCHGSEEYKTIHDQILQEYHKIKKVSLTKYVTSDLFLNPEPHVTPHVRVCAESFCKSSPLSDELHYWAS